MRIEHAGVTTVGLFTTPLGGAAIGSFQTLMTMKSDPALAAGHLWAIVRIGKITLNDGTTTTGTKMLMREIFEFE